MKKLFGAMLFIVIAIMLIPTVQNSVDTYDTVKASESFTAVETDAVAEVVTITETEVTDINYVTVNGSALELTTEYTVDGGEVTLAVDASEADDIIVVGYDYTLDMPTGVDGLMNVVLIMFVIGIVVGGAAYIKFN